MSAVNVPKKLDEVTVTTHVAQQTRDRDISRADIKRALKDGEVKPQRGNKYLLEYDDPCTVDTFCIPMVNNGGEWFMKTAFRKNSQKF
jgi:hypothetical protein